MPALCWCLSLSCIVLALGFSPAVGQSATSSADLIAGLPEVVNLSLTKYEKTPAAPGNMASQPSVKEEKTQASGFIIDPSGLIVTNRHAVSDAADLTVTLNDGTHLRGTVLAAATHSPFSFRRRASYCWCGVSFGLRPSLTPRALARSRPGYLRLDQVALELSEAA